MNRIEEVAGEEAGPDEVARHDGVVMSHRFLGGHTWMAGMRGDDEQLHLRARLLRRVLVDARVIRPDPVDAPAMIQRDVQRAYARGPLAQFVI